MKNIKNTLLLVFAVFLVTVSAQDTTKSLAYRDNKPNKRAGYFYRPDLAYQIWQQFHLIKEANAGDAAAQHELGLRYLLGEGMKADTAAGAYWVKKAAEQKFTPAAYNYGILLLNGIGTEWDPFAAFDQFLYAAEDGMAAAQYVVGMLYTDNLIVKRDLEQAYIWVKKASDENHESAKEVLKELASKVDTAAINKQQEIAANETLVKKGKKENHFDEKESSGKTFNSSLGLAYIDFEHISDTTIIVTDTLLIKDLEKIGNDEIINQIYISKKGSKDSVLSFDSLDTSLLLKFADYGSPEALTLLGKMYETGRHFPRDEITSLSYYIRAIRFDSPHAPVLLYEAMKTGSQMAQIKRRINSGDAEAMFVWHGLVALGFNSEITDDDAFNLLNRSASLGFLPAAEELAVSYYSGKMVDEDREKGAAIFKDAASKGSKSANARLITALVFSSDEITVKNFLDELQESEKNGSVLSQVTLAYCYETGTGTKLNTAEAVKYYRSAAVRGSQYAFKELQRLYNSKRPEKEKFRL